MRSIVATTNSGGFISRYLFECSSNQIEMLQETIRKNNHIFLPLDKQVVYHHIVTYTFHSFNF